MITCAWSHGTIYDDMEEERMKCKYSNFKFPFLSTMTVKLLLLLLLCLCHIHMDYGLWSHGGSMFIVLLIIDYLTHCVLSNELASN